MFPAFHAHFRLYEVDLPNQESPKTYTVQVDGEITQEAIQKLREGVTIKLKKGLYQTKPCKASKISKPDITPRNPPVRFRASIPTSWLEITIKEGKNRQIRKMCAKVGFPCLRLIRTRIKELRFVDVKMGEGRNLTEDEVMQLNA